ncbi:steroid delta-isomerase [Mycobacterium sp. 88mf]|nr:steroid delta-isomerase [Mycobacterium sp. 88mf]SFF14832.1 steroid delta-isomerase [Mycobacterium sp. 455mf]
MTETPDLTATITETVHRYLHLIATGSADQILELFADGASVEDPVGTTPRVGSTEIREFFSALGALERTTTLQSLRVCGHEAAFQFRIAFDAGDGPLHLEPIDIMTFDADGKITSVRSYFTAADIKPAAAD